MEVLLYTPANYSASMFIRFFSAMMFFICQSFAQKNDAVWQMAYKSGNPPLDFKCGINFTNASADTFRVSRDMSFFNSASVISDDSGNLLFYTNGEFIANKNHGNLKGSAHFNDGWENQSYVPLDRGLLGSQELLSIPYPGDSNKYILFHECGELFYHPYPGEPQPVYAIQPLALKYTIINMKLDSGRGAVPTGMKGLTAIEDTLFWGWIAATKHGNGRDWWVVVHKWWSDVFYKLLVTPNGVAPADTQHIGFMEEPRDLLGRDFDLRGQACFSPDGNQYAMAGQSNWLQLFDFDRCSGLLSNHRATFIDTLNRVRACSFSPNSRYLYTSDFLRIFQYDTWQSNLDSSGMVVAQWDSFVAPMFALYLYFFYHSLALDGKIYLHTFNGSLYLHLISDPDSFGIACNVMQHNFIIPNYSLNLCYSPNYRLGPAVGSGCDSLVAINEHIREAPLQLKVFPNPAPGHTVTVQYTLEQFTGGTLKIISLTGQTVYQMHLPPWSSMQQLNLSALADGMYAMQLESGTKRVAVKMGVMMERP